jgi:hypothetical protein
MAYKCSETLRTITTIVFSATKLGLTLSLTTVRLYILMYNLIVAALSSQSNAGFIVDELYNCKRYYQPFRENGPLDHG